MQVKVETWEGLLDPLRNAKTLGDTVSALFKSWEGALLALADLIGAVFAVWLAIGKFRKRPDHK